jgi:PIN domain nuclease of toxin-antitoxin system
MAIRATEAVLDTSAILALVYREPGWGKAEAWFAKGVVSSLICAEVVTHSVVRGQTALQIEQVWSALRLQVYSFDTARAMAAGLLVLRTRRLGLSLADRACLALAIELNIPAVTADRAWSKLDLPVEIRVIR